MQLFKYRSLIVVAAGLFLSIGFYSAAEHAAPVVNYAAIPGTYPAVGGLTDAPANTITVTNGGDSGPGSLRQAIADANNGDTITFDPSVGLVLLTSGELVIDTSITINPATQIVTVQRASQGPDFRIFHVMPGRTVTLQDLNITGGGGLGSGGGVFNDHATLIISNCSLTGNGGQSGGAIASDGIQGSAALAILTAASQATMPPLTAEASLTTVVR